MSKIYKKSKLFQTYKSALNMQNSLLNNCTNSLMKRYFIVFEFNVKSPTRETESIVLECVWILRVFATRHLFKQIKSTVPHIPNYFIFIGSVAIKFNRAIDKGQNVYTIAYVRFAFVLFQT